MAAVVTIAPRRDVGSTVSPSSSIILSRMMNFCALPVTVIGNSWTKRTYRGAL